MHVLRCLASAGGGVTLARLARDADLAPAKLHRYLTSFVRTGFAAQDPDTGHYLLGPEALAMGLAALRQVDVVAIAARALARFTDAVNESCFLAVWGNRGPTIVRWQESTRPVTVNVRVGSVMPVLTSATGHVFCAYMKSDELTALIRTEVQELARETLRRGCRSQAEVEELAEAVRRRGYSLIEGLLLPGVAAASAPIFDHNGRLAGAITTLGPQGSLDLSPHGAVLQALIETAKSVSRELGGG
ncbi:MAG: IclR family transcriptional regulator [Bradyrhizobium sp.]|nr:IclR family transcriptional regulator [Bradyrhizobium sp.]